jgi:hypothetical protein
VLASLWLIFTGLAYSAENNLAGTWKVVVGAEGKPALWLLKLDAEGGKLSGRVLAAAEGFGKEAELSDIEANGNRLGFTIRSNGQAYTFEGVRPTESGKPIPGSLDLNGRQMVLAQLEPTTLKSLDSFALSKETLAKQSTGPELFEAALTLLRQAEAKGARPEEVRGWAEKAFQAAGTYGPRWQRWVVLRTAEILADQPSQAAVAVDYARRAERLLGREAEADEQVRTLGLLAQALKKAGREAEGKGVEARIEKLELLAHQSYQNKVLPFKPDAYAGRKATSDRAVLVELFTGAQCPPCVAADLAFDALEKTYKPGEVVLLQYHLHIPRFDPLTSPASEARARYYEEHIEGTPTMFFNGKAAAGGGGFMADVRDKYEEYRQVIDPLLEKNPKVSLWAAATREGDKIEITAKVADLAEAGDKVRLRLALVEDWARYTGSNSLRYHHHVVRALPGGPDGFALGAKNGKHTVTIDLEEVRRDLNKYLDAGEYPPDRRPLDLRRLHVVAFVQNDATQEVLQAVRVEVK